MARVTSGADLERRDQTPEGGDDASRRDAPGAPVLRARTVLVRGLDARAAVPAAGMTHSPERTPVPPSSAPDAGTTCASTESAHKLMSDTDSGISRRSGFFALGPMLTSVPTGSSSSHGTGCNCAVRIWMSSHMGS